ncbi:tRNA-dependent cyclodipeptide synthase [Sorangium sp. So ce302]|uniref:tRNA-dependent cyclodipeptide synthase n=1 Tax=Sorangium sp. So ce302 TaxID=3133297 RepID=UPI003F639439
MRSEPIVGEHLSPWQQIDWDRLDVEELVSIQRKARTAIEAKRKHEGKLRHANSGARTLPEPLYPGKEGYRTIIQHVAPARLRGAVDTLDRCVLGVSLGGSNAATFHGAKLEAIVRWIAARANHCCVLVGDSLGRISLEVREGMAPDVAEREARALGRRYVAETEAIFRRYTTDQITFEFRYGTEFADHPRFRPYLGDVRAVYDENAAFRETVHAFASEYLARTARSIGQGEAGPSERWKTIAREYLIEEVALLACFAADGWSALVYPGSIDSIVEVAEGRFPALPVPLQAFQFISLWLDSKSGSR